MLGAVGSALPARRPSSSLSSGSAIARARSFSSTGSSGRAGSDRSTSTSSGDSVATSSDWHDGQREAGAVPSTSCSRFAATSMTSVVSVSQRAQLYASAKLRTLTLSCRSAGVTSASRNPTGLLMSCSDFTLARAASMYVRHGLGCNASYRTRDRIQHRRAARRAHEPVRRHRGRAAGEAQIGVRAARAAERAEPGQVVGQLVAELATQVLQDLVVDLERRPVGDRVEERRRILLEPDLALARRARIRGLGQLPGSRRGRSGSRTASRTPRRTRRSDTTRRSSPASRARAGR